MSAAASAVVGAARPTEWARSWGRWVSRHRLAVVLGLLAATPVLGSVVRALLAGWTPADDDALVATRAFDVFSTHGPLLGDYTDASLKGVGPLYDAGPLLFWLFAVPARLLGDWALPVTAGVVNTASIMGIVALARRRGGRLFMLVTAAAVAIMCRSLPAEVWHDVLDPSPALMPFTLLVFLAWSILCGDYRLLPLAVLVLSFVTQTHFSFAGPCIGMSLVVLAALLYRRRRRLDEGPAGKRRQWILGGLFVAVVCWIPPLLDQAFNRPGNLSRVLRVVTSHQKTLGVQAGWHTLVRATGVWPWWLRPASSPGGRLLEVIRAPSAAASVSCVLILAGLGVVGLLGLRRRRPDIAAAAALALVLNGAVVYEVSSTPSRLVLAVFRAVRWTSPAGMFTWLVLGWSVAVLLGPATRRSAGWARVIGWSRWSKVAWATALSVLALLAGSVVHGQQPDLFQWGYRPVRALVSGITSRLPRGRTYLVASVTHGDLAPFDVQAAVIYQLRRRGYRVVATPDNLLALVAKLGSYYSAARYRATTALLVEENNMPSHVGAQLLARVGIPEAPTGVEPNLARSQRGLRASMLPVSVYTAPRHACSAPTPPVRVSTLAGIRLRIVTGQVAGEIEIAQIVGNTAYICGWAAGTHDHHAAGAVLVYSDGKLIAAVKPTISRPDVAGAYGPAARASGYSIWLPLSRLSDHRIQVIATQGTRASRLSSLCGRTPHDFGC